MFAYIFGIPIWWIMVGVLANGHKGAVAAGAWGLICVAYIALILFINAFNWRSDTTKSGALATVLAFAGPPVVLIAWGRHDAHGSDGFWIIFWFTVAAVVVYGAGKLGAIIKEKMDY